MATYYVRADGTASSKATATDPTSASTSMSVTTFNGESFAAGDIIRFSNRGGNFTTAVVPPSSGTSGTEIIYEGEPGYLPLWTSNSWNINGLSHVRIKDIEVNSTATSNFIFQGSGSNVITMNLIAKNSSNQCFQHLNTISVEHHNLYASGASDEGLSCHDSPTVTILGGIIENNDVGCNYIDTPNLTMKDVRLLNNTTRSLQPSNTGGISLFERCFFKEASPTIRIIDCSSAAFYFYNCIFSRLSVTDYYMLFRSTMTAGEVINCVFAGAGYGNCSAIFNQYASGIYRNNIFHTPGSQSFAYTTGTITHNCFYNAGTARGSDYITDDPKFEHITNDNFYLQPDSPCIDAGYNAAAYIAECNDFADHPRPQGDAWDMGAYEYITPPVTMIN